MAKATEMLLRLVVLLCAFGLFALDVSDAYAQTANCRQLGNTLSAIERSGDYQSLDDINAALRDAQDRVQRAESRYIRDGCNAAAKRGEKLSPQCRSEARDVLQARADRDAASRQADTGNAVAQQREAVLQEMARFNCDSRSSAGVTQQRRGSLFDQLFGAFEDNFSGGDGVSTRSDQFSGEAGYETVRTVCVRKVDGYYWPISFSTLVQYAPNDLITCQQECPGMDVDLYYYDNPGQDPSQMVNLQGEPYTALPTAFAYRTKYDPANSCHTQVTYGTVNLAVLPDGSQRAMVSYEGQIFPLPVTDPREQTDVKVVQVAAANYIDVPLPRPRPAAPGEAPKPVAVKQAANSPERIVMFGDKRVRIVGPNTPYAQADAAGT